jgi:hypothetical protein
VPGWRVEACRAGYEQTEAAGAAGTDHNHLGFIEHTEQFPGRRILEQQGGDGDLWSSAGCQPYAGVESCRARFDQGLVRWRVVVAAVRQGQQKGPGRADQQHLRLSSLRGP